MDRFYAKGGQFWLNDKPQLIQAGEFHYFRTPHEQWRHRLGLLKAAGFNTLATYIPWRWHQLGEDVTDLDGHSHPLRNLAGFLDLAAEMGFWIIPRPGPYIMAETINEGIPTWVFDRYPQVAFIDRSRVPQNIVSYLHPDFQRCVAKWYRAVFGVLAPRQITRGGRIIMIQLDNEMGMMPWVRNIIDTNPDTMARFADYLTTTYPEEPSPSARDAVAGVRTRSAYGPHLPDRYQTGHLAESLRIGISHPEEPCSSQIVEDYRRFYRSYLRDYASFLWSEAKTNGMEVLPVINIHGFGNGGKTFPIGLSQLVTVMAMDGMMSATDVYPLFIGEGNFHQLLLVNEMTKALHNKQQPLFSMEFQSGGNHDFGGSQTSMYDLHTRLCLSSGMRAINHYLFFGGENDPLLSPEFRHDWGPPVRRDGTLRKHYFRYPKLSKVLDTGGSDLTLSQPVSVTAIGFLLDYFMTEVNNECTQQSTKILTHQRDAILFDMIARGLSLTHRPFTAIDLDRGDLDVVQTPLCWVMMEKQCDAATQQKLVDYVQRGGKLVLAGRMCVEDFHHQECTILKDAIGIKHTEGDLAKSARCSSDPPFSARSISAFNHHDVPVTFLETYSGDLGEVFATREDGAVAGFVKTIGSGKVMMFGAAMTANCLEDLDVVHQMAMKMGCPPLFELSDWADVRLSRGENGSFLFINNYQDDPVETTIQCAGQTLFGGNAVHLPARRGFILPLDWQLRKGVTLHYATAEIVELTEDGSTITLRTEPDEFFAELSLSGYRCERSITLGQSAGSQRVRLQSKDGVIKLTRSS